MRRRARKRNRLNKNKLTSLPGMQPIANDNTSVELLQYSLGDCEYTKLTSHADLRTRIDENKVNWFRVTGISDVEYVSDICKNFGLHSFDIKDLLTDPHVVKVVLYNDITFGLVSGFHLNAEEELEDEQMAFILGNNFVISFKETSYPVFREVEKNIKESNQTIRRKGADYLFYALLNSVNTMNNELIIKSEELLFTIEDKLIMQQENIDILHYLHSCRITHMQLKRFMSSFREEHNNLLDNDNKLVLKENLIYFENLDDKLRTTSDNLSNYQESLISLLDLYYSNNNLKLNEVIKRLTLVSTIFIPLTFLVGVWGMNFKHMPELEWKYGYLAAWSLFFVVVIAILFLLRKKRWF